MTTQLAARVAVLERRMRRRGLRVEAERLLAEDAELAAITDAEEIVAEAERLLARGDPDVLAALAQARRAEWVGGDG
jgi:hypothetical protein